MNELIIALVQATLATSDYFKNIYGLCQQVTRDEKRFPAYYCTKDNFKPVDLEPSALYFRQRGSQTRTESSENGATGCDRLVTVTMPFIAVAYVPKDIFKTDNAYINEKVSSNIANIISRTNYKQLKQILKANDIEAFVRSIDQDAAAIWASEYRNIPFAARHDHVYCAINFDIVIDIEETCLINFECDNVEVDFDTDLVTVTVTDPNAWHKDGDTVSSTKTFGTKTNFGIDIITGNVIRWQILSNGSIIPASGQTVTLGSENNPVPEIWVDTIHYNIPIPNVIKSINGLTASAQLFATGTAGTDFGIVSAGNTHTFNIPIASAVNTGKLSATDWSTFNSKQNAITLGTTAQYFRGDLTLGTFGSDVRDTLLSGLSVSGGTITAADNILQAFGKAQNQINALIGGVNYRGTWNASTNSPTLASGVGTKGYYYVVNVAGSTNLDGVPDWNLGDWAIFNGTAWEKVDNTDAVISVNGQTGIVVLNSDNITQGSTNLYLTGSAQTFAGVKTFASAPILSGFTQNSVLFVGSGGAISQDNAAFNWNDANKKLTITSTTLTGGVDINVSDVSQVNSAAYGHRSIINIATFPVAFPVRWAGWYENQNNGFGQHGLFVGIAGTTDVRQALTISIAGTESTTVRGNGQLWHRGSVSIGNYANTPSGVQLNVRGASNSTAIVVETSGANKYIECIEVSGVRRMSVFGATPVIRQTMGAATAGATYTAAEQAMLQAVYNAVRNFGIGT